MNRDSRLKREAPRRETGSARKGESDGLRSKIALILLRLDISFSCWKRRIRRKFIYRPAAIRGRRG